VGIAGNKIYTGTNSELAAVRELGHNVSLPECSLSESGWFQGADMAVRVS
jgi:hypothetical protein